MLSQHPTDREHAKNAIRQNPGGLCDLKCEIRTGNFRFHVFLILGFSEENFSGRSRISQKGQLLPIFPENCMKMKKKKIGSTNRKC